jgi:hypothetical protein
MQIDAKLVLSKTPFTFKQNLRSLPTQSAVFNVLLSKWQSVPVWAQAQAVRSDWKQSLKEDSDGALEQESD